MHSFRDGGQPHVLVELPTGQRRLLKAEVVATDWEHDVAVLRVKPNPFEGGYRVAFLPLATERLAPGKNVFSVSLRPSSLEEAYTFDAPLEDRAQGEVLSYQYTRTEKGREIELLLYSQKVIPGQSGSPVISEETGEVVGFIEGRWLHPTAIPFVTTFLGTPRSNPPRKREAVRRVPRVSRVPLLSPWWRRLFRRKRSLGVKSCSMPM